MIPLLLQIANFPPKKVSSGPCQEVVYEGDKVDLNMLPALKCWPEDGGRYITMPLVAENHLAERRFLSWRGVLILVAVFKLKARRCPSLRKRR